MVGTSTAPPTRPHRAEGTPVVHEAIQVCFRSHRSHLPQKCDLQRKRRHGPKQGVGNRRLTAAHHSARSPRLLGVGRLQPLFHLRLWNHLPSPDQAAMQRGIHLEHRSRGCLPRTNDSPSPIVIRLRAVVHYGIRCVRGQIWHRPSPGRQTRGLLQ
jgi:hypothetical protein